MSNKSDRGGIFQYPENPHKDVPPPACVTTAVDQGANGYEHIKVTIPQDFVREFGIDAGDKLGFWELEGEQNAFKVKVADNERPR